MAGSTGFNINPMAFFRSGDQNPNPNGTPDPNANKPGAGSPGAGTSNMEPNNKGAGAGTGNGAPDLTNTGGNGDPNNKGTGSPLDAFTDFFTIKDNKGNQPADPFATPFFNLDPKKLGEAVSKMDFTRTVNPELVTKVFSGNPQEAGPALMEILNSVGRGAFAAAMQANTGMVERGFGNFRQRYDSVLEGRFRDFQVNSTQSSNPALKHPAAQPVLAAIKQMFASQNPNLPASEVQSKAEDYFLAMSKAINSVGDGNAGNSGGGSGKGSASEPDYSMFLTQ